MEHVQDFSISAKGRFALPAIELRWIVFLVVVILAFIGGLAYWRYRELYPVTDDAYASAGVLRVVAETSGPVTHVYVRNDERVTKDDPLFDVDPTLYEGDAEQSACVVRSGAVGGRPRCEHPEE
jgi:multidrug resistance efflux pump